MLEILKHVGAKYHVTLVSKVRTLDTAAISIATSSKKSNAQCELRAGISTAGALGRLRGGSSMRLATEKRAARQPELREARSRLYRHQFLHPNTHFSAFFEI